MHNGLGARHCISHASIPDSLSLITRPVRVAVNLLCPPPPHTHTHASHNLLPRCPCTIGNSHTLASAFIPGSAPFSIQKVNPPRFLFFWGGGGGVGGEGLGLFPSFIHSRQLSNLPSTPCHSPSYVRPCLPQYTYLLRFTTLALSAANEAVKNYTLFSNELNNILNYSNSLTLHYSEKCTSLAVSKTYAAWGEGNNSFSCIDDSLFSCKCILLY